MYLRAEQQLFPFTFTHYILQTSHLKSENSVFFSHSLKSIGLEQLFHISYETL